MIASQKSGRLAALEARFIETGRQVAVASDLEARYYGAVTCYSNSALTRMRLGRAFRLGARPHILGTAEWGGAFLGAKAR